MGEETPCFSNDDCYNFTGIVKKCYFETSFSNKTNFCDCSNWFGWRGDQCNKPSVQLYYFRVLSFIYIAWAFLLIGLTARSARYHLFMKLKEKRPFNPVFYTAVLMLVGLVIILINYCIVLYALFNPEGFEVTSYNSLTDDFDDVSTVYGRFVGFAYPLSTAFMVAAALQIIISWIDVITPMTSNFPSIFLISSQSLREIIRVAVVIDILLIVLVVSLSLLYAVTVLVFTSASLIAVVYVLGYRRFFLLQKMLNFEKRSSNVKSVSLISKANFVNASCMVIICFSAIPYFFLFRTVGEHLKPGSFNYVMFCRDVGTFAAFYMLTFQSWYIHRVTANIFRLKNVPWLVFYPHRKPKKEKQQRTVTVGSENELVKQNEPVLQQTQSSLNI